MLNTKEAMEKYNICRETIKRRIKDGKLHPIKEKGKNYFDECELDVVFKKEDKLDKIKRELKEYYGYDPYIFLDNEYKDIFTPMKLICVRCNNEITVSINNMKNNMRLKRDPQCKYCGAKATSSKNTKKNEAYLQELSDICKGDYTLLEDYIDYDTPIMHKCNICDYEWKVSPSNLILSYKKGKHPCPSCNNMVRDDRPYEERLKEVNDTIIPLEEYVNRRTKILHKCTICGYEWKCTPNSRLSGNGCPKCSNKITQSKSELEVIEFLKENNIDIEVKDRTILNGKEIDILARDYNIGIEINGNYWHSEKYKGKKYHLDKTIDAKNNGIRLIQILDDEWNNKKDITKSKLLYLFNKNNNLPRIYARKCTVKEISPSEKNDFLNKNHIQGGDTCNIKLGLFYEDKLVSVMTFAKPRIPMGQGGKKMSYDYELSRFASDINYIVVGGFSKIFKYFERNYEWNSLISYADRRWSEGNLYIKNGWDHIRDTKPNYWYVNKNTKKRYHRYNFRKQVLKEKFPNLYEDNLTEFEIMDKTIYFRIWDCGNMVFAYTKK